VDYYRVHADKFEQHDIFGEAFFKVLVSHCIPAIFNHDGFVKEAFDPPASIFESQGKEVQPVNLTIEDLEA